MEATIVVIRFFSRYVFVQIIPCDEHEDRSQEIGYDVWSTVKGSELLANAQSGDRFFVKISEQDGSTYKIEEIIRSDRSEDDIVPITIE